jgi:uncharacterized protein (TIGR03067 family)
VRRSLLPLAIVALLSPAFAPAPLPKPARRGPPSEITLETFQGKWRVVNMETSRANGQHTKYQWTVTHIGVRGNRWEFMTGNNGFSGRYLTIDHTKRPAHLNFYDDEARRGGIVGVGLIRRHQGKVQVIYTWGGENVRPTFDPPCEGPWIITMQRD